MGNRRLDMKSPLLEGSVSASAGGARQQRMQPAVHATYGSTGDAAGHFPGREHSPAYHALMEQHVLIDKYKIDSASDIEAREANTTYSGNALRSCAACIVPPVVGFVLLKALTTYIEVPRGYVRPYTYAGEYHFAGPGLHFFGSPFVMVAPANMPLPTNGCISHGTRHLVVVEQGLIGLAFDAGQPVLLGPGLHQVRDSETFTFQECVALDSTVVALGPYTLVTVEVGYKGVAYNNGKQVILDPGTHFLHHRNFVFRKFLPFSKVQTDVLEALAVTTADNVLINTTATVCWVIEDVDLAARASADMMSATRQQESTDISKLREDVMRQAEASLAAFIGGVNYSDKGMGLAAHANDIKGERPTEPKAAIAADGVVTTAMDDERLNSSVGHANSITCRYGVRILSINIISIAPNDHELRSALAQGAVAAANAVKLETEARGKALARKIDAESIAAKNIIQARGEAEAERLRAEGAKAAGELLQSSEIATRLAEIERTGAALSDKSTIFLNGTDPAAGVLGKMLSK